MSSACRDSTALAPERKGVPRQVAVKIPAKITTEATEITEKPVFRLGTLGVLGG